jgi:NADH-quinone oxidoreductase subunit E
MLPKEIKTKLLKQIAQSEQAREQAIHVMYALQQHYGYLSDDAVREAAALLDMTPLEIDELATFYDFIYREPVGRYLIHVCDSAVCWRFGHESVLDYLSGKLGIGIGETTKDGLFTLLTVCCVGFCDHAPVMLINGQPYGDLTPESIDQIIDNIRKQLPPVEEDR